MKARESTRAVGRFFDAYAADFDAIYGHTKRRRAFGRWIDRLIASGFAGLYEIRDFGRDWYAVVQMPRPE